MDPYLEGYLWPDVHHALATQIRNQLVPLLAPNYVARIVIRTVAETLGTGEFIGVMVPDVEVFSGRQKSRATPPAQPGGVATLDEVMPAPVTLPQRFTYVVEIPSIEIRDLAGGRLITSIEILSPTNKRGSGWDEYQAKRWQVIRAQAHLVEIDLLHQGRRHVVTGRGPYAPYYVFLTRVGHAEQVEVWPVQLTEKLPTVPIPLGRPGEEVALSLQTALSTIYDEARYDLSIDYNQAPHPPLEGPEAQWAQDWLGKIWREKSED
jgi:hypothetical protein